MACLAPAGYHLTFARAGTGIGAHARSTCSRSTPRTGRPWTSCSGRPRRCSATACSAVVLTGMGSDGRGGRLGQGPGRRVFTEAEETCVVYGMPRSVAEAGLSDHERPAR